MFRWRLSFTRAGGYDDWSLNKLPQRLCVSACVCKFLFACLFRYLSAVFLQLYHGACERTSLCFACTFSRAWEVYAIGVSVCDAVHAHSFSRAWEVYAMGVSVCDAIVSEWSWSESRPMRTTPLLHYYSTSTSLLFHYYAVVLRGYSFGQQSVCDAMVVSYT